MSENGPTGKQTALRCFVAIANRAGVDLSFERLVHEHALGTAEPNTRQLLRIIRSSGMRAKTAKLKPHQLADLGSALPVMARISDDSMVVIVAQGRRGDQDIVGLFDPQAQTSQVLAVPAEQFFQRWTGEVVFVKPASRITDPQQPFGIGWFVPEMLRQSHLFVHVGIAALMLLMIGFAVPLFFQIVIDKVLPHESYSTLYVLSIAVGVALVFEAVFGFLRRYLLLYATNRIDIRTATRTFGRLMHLSTGFFEHIPAGVLVRHMQQVRSIREFLSGRLFVTLLDSLSLVVFLPLLLIYSLPLTALVLGFSVLIGINIAIMLPLLRKRLLRLYDAESRRQAFLTETVHGIVTVKSLALEPLQRREWEELSTSAIRSQFDVGRLSQIAQATTGLLEKLLIVGIIFVGAHLVFDGAMTLGALVAFQMLANRVSSPLVALIGLVQEYQEAAISVRMLGTVMNQPPERLSDQRGLRPDMQGAIEFSEVTVSYGPDMAPAVRDVSFRIASGALFGIVGTSGAGKTTVTRLIQGLITPQRGIVRMDGVDIKEIDLVHLRQNLGVVLQENFIFHGTIRSNIGMGKPDASIEEIVEAARLGGALEFIEKLPQGFDTVLEGKRHQPVRRAEAAPRHCPGADPQAAHPAVRRSDQRPRSGKRGDRDGEPQADRRRPHPDHDFAPPVLAHRSRRHSRARQGRRGGAWYP